MRSVFRLRSTSARVVTISHTYRPAPCSRHSCRNATFVMPAMGASTTGGSTGYGPRRRVTGSSLERSPVWRGRRFPHRVVVREDHPGRVEPLKPVDPLRRRKVLGVAVPAGAPGERLPAVRGGAVVTLPGHHDGTVRPSHDEGLVAGGMAGRRHHEDAGQDLR